MSHWIFLETANVVKGQMNVLEAFCNSPVTAACLGVLLPPVDHSGTGRTPETGVCAV